MRIDRDDQCNAECWRRKNFDIWNVTQEIDMFKSQSVDVVIPVPINGDRRYASLKVTFSLLLNFVNREYTWIYMINRGISELA
jgi:hypothetical protein